MDRLAIARQARQRVAEVEVHGSDDEHTPAARRVLLRAARQENRTVVMSLFAMVTIDALLTVLFRVVGLS